MVSVVIPTCRRADLLGTRALPSALGQTLQDIEIIVVLDGPDSDTQARLAASGDPRLRSIVLPEPVGGSEARNVGVRAARAPWIAFLDDDDVWLPHKLADQVALASRLPGWPIVACPWVTRTPHGDMAAPQRPPQPGEALGDYMLAWGRAGARGTGLVSSVLLAPRDLLLAVPFAVGLPKHQDWDWLLRASLRPGVAVHLTERPAAIWFYEEARPAVSRTLNWQASRAWAWQHRRLGTLSPRAFCGFLNLHVATAAQRTGQWRAFLPLLGDLLGARPRPSEVLWFLASWVVPLETRRRIGQWRHGRRRRSPEPPRRVALIDPLSGGHHAGYASQLAQALRARGHEVLVVGPQALVAASLRAAPGIQGRVLDPSQGSLEAYYRLPRPRWEWRNIQFTRAALRAARRWQADTVHFLYLDSYLVSLVLGAATSWPRPRRLRATLHWTYFLRPFKQGRWAALSEAAHLTLLRVLGALGTGIMMHSELLVAAIRTRLPRLQIGAVPYLAPPPATPVAARDSLRAAVRARLDLPEDTTLLLAFGGTRHDKGLDIALAALAHLPGSHHLAVVGRPETFGAAEIARLAGEAVGRVHTVLEHVPEADVEGYFLAADAVLIPYRRRFAGQSGPLMIAAALGIPVVASEVGVLADTVRTYNLGVLTAPEDPVALADAIGRLGERPAPDTARFLHDHSLEAFVGGVQASYEAGWTGVRAPSGE